MDDGVAVLLGAVVGAAGAVAASIVAAVFTQRESERGRAQDALQWMTGRPQSRNVGIAAIEASWNRKRNGRFRRLVTPVLCGSALYLIAASDEEAAPHELHNLDRIMALLESNSEVKQFAGGYSAVLGAIDKRLAPAGATPSKKGDAGLDVDTHKLRRWKAELEAMSITA